MGLTCSWSRAIRSAPEAFGAAAKQSFACKPGQLGPVNLPTTGRRPIGSRSTGATRTWAALARRWSMCLELRLHSWCLLSAKIRMPTWLIATISAVSLDLWPKLMSLEPTEGRPLSRTTPARERILLFITKPARSGPTELRPQIRPQSYSPGATVRAAAARPG